MTAGMDLETLEEEQAVGLREDKQRARNAYLHRVFEGIGQLMEAQDPSLQIKVVTPDPVGFYPSVTLTATMTTPPFQPLTIAFFHDTTGYCKLRLVKGLGGCLEEVKEGTFDLNDKDRLTPSALAYMATHVKLMMGIDLNPKPPYPHEGVSIRARLLGRHPDAAPKDPKDGP